MRASSIARYFFWAGLLAGVACGACGWASDVGAEAREVLAISGVKGGVVVHLGCGDGRLTGALRENAGYTVQGLDRDAGKVDAARSHIRGLGLYGPVSVERLAGTVLPYCESLINLAVVEDLALVPHAEVMRVLAPGGVMCRREGGHGRDPSSLGRTGSTSGRISCMTRATMRWRATVRLGQRGRCGGSRIRSG